MWGNVVTTVLPGSSVILDWATNQLVPCTPDTCYDNVTLPNGTVRFYNRAPYHGDATIYLLLNKNAPEVYKLSVVSAFSTDNPDVGALVVSCPGHHIDNSEQCCKAP